MEMESLHFKKKMNLSSGYYYYYYYYYYYLQEVNAWMMV